MLTGSLEAGHGLPAFSATWGVWVAVVAAAALYALAVHRPAYRASGRQMAAFVGAAAVCLAVLGWPVAPVAAHRLLLALVVQRLALLLALPPLLVASLPHSLVDAATRPAPLDALGRVLSRPGVAVAVVTAVAVGTLTVPAVQAQSSTVPARAGLDLALAAAGLVLWLPVLQPVPGTRKLSALSRAAYLVIQSIVPSFLCIVWIFAHHPLYPVYAHSAGLFGLTPLVDQQLSGFVAKLATIFVLWTVAGLGVLRAERVEEEGGDPEPLTWADVARQLQRVERRERQGHLPGPLGPVSGPRGSTGRWARPVPPGYREADPGAGGARGAPAPGTPPSRGPGPGWALGSASAAHRPRLRAGRRRRRGDG